MTQEIRVVHDGLPVLALRGLVVFPGMSLQFEVGRRKSIAALRAAMEKGHRGMTPVDMIEKLPYALKEVE